MEHRWRKGARRRLATNGAHERSDQKTAVRGSEEKLGSAQEEERLNFNRTPGLIGSKGPTADLADVDRVGEQLVKAARVGPSAGFESSK